MSPRLAHALVAVLALLTGGAASGASTQVSIEVDSRAPEAGQSVLVRGRIAVARAGEDIQVEQNPCGLGWGVLPAARGTTTAGGLYAVALESNLTPAANSLVRTRWQGELSEPVPLQVRPWLYLRRSWGKLRVEVVGTFASRLVLQRRHVVIEGRRAGGLWRPIARLKLRLKNTPYGEMPVGSMPVPGSRYAFFRAALPASQARPCYSPTMTDPIRA
jgi:hypothetical protein